MTTPRVTVPVEPTEARRRLELFAGGASIAVAWSDNKFDAMSPFEAIRADLTSMLSAAPAPEGGAVSTGAQAVIRNGQIVISVDVDALPLILSGSIALNAVAGTFKVTDAAIFAKEVCYAMNAEKEDGTTRVHMMFDSAFNHAIDQGAEGVDEINEDEFEAEAARLQAEAQAALRAQQPAREDAGAVKCPRCYRGEVFGLSMDDGFWVEFSSASGGAHPAGMHGWLELAEHHPDGRMVVREYVAKDSPIYPAPDALRVAVEALETINHIRSEMVGVPVDSEAANAWALALDAAADHARQALAALQAEQKGGAA